MHSQATADRRTISFDNGGAGRGAHLMQTAIAEYNRTSERAELRPLYVDPQPGKARELALQGRDLGVLADYREDTIQASLTAPGDRIAPLVLNLDHPRALAECLEAAGSRPVLAYTLIVSPRGRMYGVRMVYTSDTETDRRSAVGLFRSLATVVANSGADAVFGLSGAIEHSWQEPVYRSWFSEHMTTNVYRVVSGVPSENAPMEITPDGHTTMPVIICEVSAWEHPASLANRVVDNLPQAIVRGQDFAIAEIARDGLRIHPVRLRHTDGRTAVYDTVAIDPDAVAESEEEDRLLRERAAKSLKRAENDTLTRRDAALMTD